MAIVVERPQPTPPADARRRAATTPSGWAPVVAGASIAAGAIHAAAAGAHAEHGQAVAAFTALAVLQTSGGIAALLRPLRTIAVLAAMVNAAALAGWAIATTSGIGFIEGLEEAEPVQTADGLAAAAAGLAVLAAMLWLLRAGERAHRRGALPLGGLGLLVASLAIPGMVTAGTHDHGDHDTVDAADLPVVPPRPYDPSLPIDLSGVEGVTPEQQARAENLVAVTVLRLPQFADPDDMAAMGFVSIGDGALGYEHYLHAGNMADDRILDPDYPESLVFDTRVTPKRLVAAMYMLDAGDTLDDVPELGGRLTQWHVHDNLCFIGPRVAGLTDAEGNCGPGLTKGAETPMIHVWIEPHPCGPFAALEGVAGGTIPEGEERWCDHVHGSGG